MTTFLFSSVESCEGGHGLCRHLLEKGISSREEGSALPSPREKGRTVMGTFLLSSVKSREGGHGLCHHLLEKRGTAC